MDLGQGENADDVFVKHLVTNLAACESERLEPGGEVAVDRESPEFSVHSEAQLWRESEEAKRELWFMHGGVCGLGRDGIVRDFVDSVDVVFVIVAENAVYEPSTRRLVTLDGRVILSVARSHFVVLFKIRVVEVELVADAGQRA